MAGLINPTVAAPQQEDGVFTSGFLSTPNSAIEEALRTQGVFSSPAALQPDFLHAIRKDVARTDTGLNRNWITGVYTERQFYNCHMLATSRAFVNLATHPKLFGLFETLLGNHFRLKAHRYYETYDGHHMQWHTDNKTDRGFAPIPGVIVIAYVDDVEDGEFQYVRGSQRTSGQSAYNDYTDQFIEDNHSDDILSFKGPKGTIVIYDTYGIHRAKPVMAEGYVRKSLFFQVDNAMDAAEPLLINPEYLTTFSAEIWKYLGFGQPSGYSIFPETNASVLPERKLREILNSIPRQKLIDALPRKEILQMLPRQELTQSLMQRAIAKAARILGKNPRNTRNAK